MIRPHFIREKRTAAALVCTVLILGIGACDLNDPDEIQNQANMALVRVQIFASNVSRTPVPGVRMIVEAPPPESGGGGGAQQRRYEGPDVIALSGEDGLAEAFVFPGYDSEQAGETPPTSPFDLPPALIFADVRVVFIYNGQVLPFLDGLTVGSGRLYDLGSVFLLEDFGIVVD
ncbi:MAG TPA: hypothetical protein VEY33_12015 [Gemmatimonadota bacterium]|nr:hypothetical protein [Gemmatimonadota bacterium]